MKMMRFLTDSDRVVVDIHPEWEEPEFVSICPMCTLPLVLGGYIAEQKTSDPDVRVFALEEGHTWEEIQGMGGLCEGCGNKI